LTGTEFAQVKRRVRGAYFGRRLFAASRKFAAFLLVLIDRGINLRSARPNRAATSDEETMNKRLARPGLRALAASSH
jgi:hypothetical protein